MTAAPTTYAVVVPSMGRPSLQWLLDTLAAQDVDADHPGPLEVVVVDDRPGDVEPLRPSVPGTVAWTVRTVRGHGRGPAAARNRGWRVARRSGAQWVAFLDDDVELPAGWAQRLAEDLAACGPEVGATQGRIDVPLPGSRRPTDWERNTASLQDADWATADMAYRTIALEAVSGFDERFPRAYREDADLALRVRRAGWQLVRGQRRITHPVRPADDLVSLRVQAGNADDALMRRLHGPDWRRAAEAPPGGFRWHAATVAALGATGAGAGAALTATALGHRPARRSALAAAGAGAAAWGWLTGRFVLLRTVPGPRPGDPEFLPELSRMVRTSVTIPVAAVRHKARGWWRNRGTGPWPVPVRAVLFDRDGTLVHDVPYNGDPDAVELVPGAREAVDAVRAAGLRVGVVSNQSGIGRGLLTREQVDAVNARVAELLGPFDTWQLCPHAPEQDCACRKPRPGMVLAAAAELGVDPSECVLVGDIGADVEAAQAAGARSVLVPTPVTREEEVAAAPVVARTLREAVAAVLAPAADGGTAARPDARPVAAEARG
ncbi:HAD-IIIA family hydrolase [Kocuria sp. WN036]|uniref:HAD-IIIA family hydrolase n=1 Tax=Kocuria sp. WN036 TaxID=2032628 RepID=UPI0015951968|nr:HAD-IIIA family hydrolase [Kocuria sp. WN036]